MACRIMPRQPLGGADGAGSKTFAAAGGVGDFDGVRRGIEKEAVRARHRTDSQAGEM